MPPPSPGPAAEGTDSPGPAAEGTDSPGPAAEGTVSPGAAEGTDGETWFREMVSDTLGGRLALLRPAAADTPTGHDTVSHGRNQVRIKLVFRVALQLNCDGPRLFRLHPQLECDSRG